MKFNSMALTRDLAKKRGVVTGHLYQGTTSVVPSGLQSALVALKTDHFLSAEGLRAAPSVGAERI